MTQDDGKEVSDTKVEEDFRCTSICNIETGRFGEFEIYRGNLSPEKLIIRVKDGRAVVYLEDLRRFLNQIDDPIANRAFYK